MIPTFSPQGDGNLNKGELYIPADKWNVDPYLFPARGRKLEAGTVPAKDRVVDPYLFPARGRKLC